MSEQAIIRKEANRRAYLARKLREDPTALQTLVSKRRELDAQIAELREIQKTHVIPVSEEGQKLQALASEIIEELIATLKDHEDKWQLLLMVSEDLRTLALKGE